MLTAWVLCPVALVALAVGCALVVERVAGVRLTAALLLPVGVATMIVAGQLTTSFDATAELTVPVVVGLAVAGMALGWRELGRRFDGWAVLAAAVVFAAYGLPILLSGEPTMTGYIRLDDSATWLALTDRVMEHGHSLAGLAPSSYEATLAFNLGDGYPIGVFLPLGIAHVVTGVDPAWLLHPYMSLLAACLALSLWQILEPLVQSRPLRAAATAVAAQPALLVGYVQWGGIKEIAAAALIAAAVALVPRVIAVESPRGWAVLLGVAVAALLAVLSLGGAIWVLPAVAAGGVLLARRVGVREVGQRAVWAAVPAVLLSLPLLVPALLNGRLLPPTSSPLTDETAKGNLIEPLGLERLLGIWPAGDFRLDPVDGDVAGILMIVVFGAALAGVWYAREVRAPGPLLYTGGVLVSCLVLVFAGSPWVDGKSLATASVAILTLGAGGAAAAIVRGRTVEGGVALLAIAAGVAWSNLLASRDVNLAPYDQLVELEQIGQAIAGQGPTLMTEYQPYGVRHFLREADPEGVSELRRRLVPLRSGKSVKKGLWADTDELDPSGLLIYETLVLRRSPAQSRPPSPYQRRFAGDYYEVWQRAAESPSVLAEHRPFGNIIDPAAPVTCSVVKDAAARSASGKITYATAAPRIVVSPTDLDLPTEWGPTPDGVTVATGDGTVVGNVTVPTAGPWTVWARGSVRGRMELRIDGEVAGRLEHDLNNEGLYAELGSGDLEAGTHELELVYDADDLLEPGSGGRPEPLGPFVLMPAELARDGLRQISAQRATRLCGRRLDWIEATG